MKKQLLTLSGIIIFGIAAVSAQVPLDTFIGQDHMPADGDSICYIPIYPEVSTNLEGPLEGTLVHDFKLYTLEGDSVQLSTVLNDIKPVLLIGCNYTCYVYRGKLDVVNDMQSLYGDLVDIYLVYTVEAHPVIDFSPYFGYENVGADNYAEGILYRQPTTYGERKAIVSDMMANMDIHVPVLIDGPCNEFWSNWGTNPNPAWLITPDGIVYDAQKWFNKEPDDMYASLDSLLNIVGTGVYEPTGTFTAADEGEPVYYGTVENTIAAHITLTNPSTDNVLIDFVRTSEDVPDGWFTAMCTDLCYSPNEDSSTVFLAPGATEIVRVDFFTDITPATGSVNISCVNHNDPTNNYSFTLNAESIAATPVINMNAGNGLSVYPNPAVCGGNWQIVSDEKAPFTVWSVDGKMMMQGELIKGNNTIGIPAEWPAGNYCVSATAAGKSISTPLMITK